MERGKDNELPGVQRRKEKPYRGPEDPDENGDVQGQHETVGRGGETPVAFVQAAEKEQQHGYNASRDREQHESNRVCISVDALLQQRHDQQERAKDCGEVEDHHAGEANDLFPAECRGDAKARGEVMRQSCQTSCIAVSESFARFVRSGLGKFRIACFFLRHMSAFPLAKQNPGSFTTV